jgi:hypothetical protein
MEKLQAQNLIKEVLQSKFNKELFVNFIRNLCKDYEEKNQYNSGSIIPDAFKEHISAFERIGKYTDNNNEVLDIFIVQTKTVSKLERTRTALRNFIVWNLKKSEKQYGLVAFYSKEDDGADWRLSLIKIDYESYRDDKNKIKISEELVPAKRFSYLVGESEHSYTAQNQLFPLLVNNEKPNIAKTKEHDNSLESAFSIEKVTNEFYEQYKGLYLRMTENLVLIETLQKEEIDIVRFVKKTLGQIVFLYFLQKKGWLGVAKNDKMGNGSKRFLQDRFESIAETNKNYFNDFLRYLFYEALAKQHNDDGIKDYIKKLDCKIPFLNGGLFEADYQNWQHVNILIPNEIFRNNEINKAGDKGTGILDVFDRYNFTIKEDEPLEKEVAIDPEMLGKVFEQMLEVKERKSKGAFYTPREIVHYMCQESLINYIHSELTESETPVYQSIDTQQTNLFGGETDKKGNLKLELQHRNKTEIELEDIEKFIRNGHLYLENEIRVTTYGSETPTYKYEIAESIRTSAQRIDNLLKDIKICDPAVGSGAFVVGMLNEIISARTLLNVYIGNKNNTAYYLKRHAIKESIYGADIDISAIDIARLRLWLSMIVDEEDYDSIEPLPNLDYKIVCGNSLIGLSEHGVEKYPALCDELIILKTDFFKETDEIKKLELKTRINKIIHEIIRNEEELIGHAIDFDFRLFFYEVWDKKGGFDIVIGNPPYIQLQNNGGLLAKQFEKCKFETFERTGDIYALFYEKGINILKSRRNLTFITSNKWMRAGYGKSLRKFFCKHAPLKLIDLGAGVFESATVDTNILTIEKRDIKPPKINCLALDLSKEKNIHNFEQFNNRWVSLTTLNEEAWTIMNPIEQQIKQKIERIGKPLKDWDVKINYGIKTGFNEAFIIDTETKERLCNEDPKSTEIIKPILRGRDIKRYKAEWAGLWLIFIPWHFPLHNDKSVNGSSDIAELEFQKQYPAIFNHLFQYKEQLGKRNKEETGIRYEWYALQRCAATYYKEFEKEKIIYPNMSSNLLSYFDDSKYLINQKCFIITSEKINLKYIAMMFNSKIIDFYFKKFIGATLGTEGFEMSKIFITELPLPDVSLYKNNSFLEIINLIIKNKKQNKDTTALERQIDVMVYKLYELSYDEVLVVDKDFWLSENEYNNYKTE